MKAHESSPSIYRTILFILLPLGAIVGLCVLFPFTSSTPTTPAAPGLVPSLSDPAPASSISVPKLNLGPLPSVGPVANAEDATARALLAANEQALSEYGLKPFISGREIATFNGDRWAWRQRVGYGRGDLEAYVSIAADGRIEYVRVHVLTLESKNW